MSPEFFGKPDPVTLVTVALVPNEEKGLVSTIMVHFLSHVVDSTILPLTGLQYSKDQERGAGYQADTGRSKTLHYIHIHVYMYMYMCTTLILHTQDCLCSKVITCRSTAANIHVHEFTWHMLMHIFVPKMMFVLHVICILLLLFMQRLISYNCFVF